MIRILKTILLLITLLLLGMTASDVVAASALNQLNWRRAKLGLPAYKFDAVLQVAAERSAQAQASRGSMFHNRHVGSRSGVGYSSYSDPQGRRFRTCFAFGRGTAYVGAAVAVGRNGHTYYSLDLRNTPSVRSMQPCLRCGKIH
ncbi:MAG: hypothetical protein ABGX16_07810 [Pirellulales bacterium]